MATVGNLFVNVRGRTSGLVRDLKKAHGKVSKDFYRNEALARERYTRAIGKVQAAKGMSPAIRGKRLREADLARRNLMIAQTRPARLAQRRELQMKKERLGALSFAAVSAITGLGVSSLIGLFRAGVDAARRGSQLTEQFKVLGPQGGKIVQTDVLKLQQQMAAAADPRVSAAKLQRARSEALFQQTEMEMGIFWDQVVAGFWETLDLLIQNRLVFSRSGLTAIEQQGRKAAIAAQTGGYDS